MAQAEKLTLHVLPPSHPCRAAMRALELKGLDYERVDLRAGEHAEEVERIYGAGRRTVPGLLIDGEPVHGSREIMAELERLRPEPPLYPAPMAETVRAAERWGEEELQPVGRNLIWGALHFRPEAMGTMGGGGELDPAGTDFAIRYVRAAWRYNEITAERVAAELVALPAKLDRIDELAREGVLDGEQPTAADLQIGATCGLLAVIGDLEPLLADRAAGRIAGRWFADYPGDIPAGGFPASWIPG